jgi:hypothetical protein
VWHAARETDSLLLSWYSFHKLTTMSSIKSGPSAIGIPVSLWDTVMTLQMQSGIVWAYPEAVQVSSPCFA